MPKALKIDDTCDFCMTMTKMNILCLKCGAKQIKDQTSGMIYSTELNHVTNQNFFIELNYTNVYYRLKLK